MATTSWNFTCFNAIFNPSDKPLKGDRIIVPQKVLDDIKDIERDFYQFVVKNSTGTQTVCCRVEEFCAGDNMHIYMPPWMMHNLYLNDMDEVELCLLESAIESAKKIVVVTDSFKEYLIANHNIAPKKIGVFKNGVISNFSKNYNSQNVSILRNRLGLKNKVVVSYIGTHGMAHALDFILRCSQKVEDENIHFIFVGDGAKKESLVKYGSTLKKKNFTFLDSVPKNKIIDFISLSDYALVNLKRSNEFKNVIPSKIFENIAMYKPILLGVEGEAKNLIESYKVGVCYTPENEKSFLKALIEADEILNSDFKSNCDIMLKDFDRDIIAKKMINFVKKK